MTGAKSLYGGFSIALAAFALDPGSGCSMDARGDTYRGAVRLIRHRFHGPASREHQCDALVAQFVN